MDSESLTVDRAGLARILHRSKLTISRQMSNAPDKLPPPVLGTKPRIWRIESINEWLQARERSAKADQRQAPRESFQNVAQALPAKRRAGRPRKETYNKDADGLP